ncbi:class I SAM-dependent methyltransferase [Ferviditalea candida]|uniref:SAM-dependent methyltransferase n=1 Tax=Ferviditalea candida TaxID=3108399 RepID=A0ABU5ZEK7_9BACL|nr:SAM-dependent methyltransferase [Paenibacillaceae bacterium T2]
MESANASGVPQLVQYIREQILRSPERLISFRDFMNLCLYQPEYGYYQNERSKIGKDGDFYTSSNIGGIMGELLAGYFVRTAREQWSADRLSIVEWGAGTGRLAGQIIREIQTDNPDFYEKMNYSIIESSPFHRRRLEDELAEVSDKVTFLGAEEWLQGGPYQETIVFSNELMDAFPVHRICLQEGRLYEIHVRWDERQETFAQALVELENSSVLKHLEEQGIRLSEGQAAEINLEAPQWIRKIGHAMRSGVLITIDYGDVQEEIFAPHRMNGTLLCYRKHQANDRPYAHVGEQDMTAHVNFTALIHAGLEAGLDAWSLRTQKQFLLDSGILEKLEDHRIADPFHPVVRKNRAIRQLLLSDGMSELFKVLVQKKGLSLNR